MTKHRRWIHLLVLALYGVLAVALTWPLVRYLGTHVPGSYNWAFDEYTFIWNSWWLRYSLFELGQSPLYSTHTFYPLGISLVLYTYNLLNALLSLPFQPFLSLPAISNLTFLFATVLSAYGTFLLAEYLLGSAQPRDPRSPAGEIPTAPGRVSSLGEGSQNPGLDSPVHIASFLAGLIYAFGSYRMVYAAIGHYDMWSTAWIPLFTLFLLKTIHEPRTRNAVFAGVFLVLAMLSEMIFGVFLGMLGLILLAFAVSKQRRSQIAGGWPALLKRLAVLALVAVVLYAPLLVPILGEMFGGYELAGWGDAEKLSVDLAGFVTPTALHPLGGDWTDTLRQTREGTSRFRDVNTLFLGWAGLALAIAGAIRYRKKLAAWITSAIIFAVFSLGPLLQINGRSLFDLDGLETTVPLPFILLHYIPVVKANRVPNRFGVVLMLTLAVLAGFGAYWLLKRLARSDKPVAKVLIGVGGLVLAALVLFEHLSVPLPLTDARIPEAYEQVAADPGDFAILQLPMGWRNSFGVQGAENTQTQYFQTYHNKRLLSGNISRNPPFKFDYFRQIPILESLITIQTYGQVVPERRAADRETAGEFSSFYDVRYVVVAPGVPGRPPYVDTREEAVAYVEEVLPLEKIYDDEEWLVYRVEQPSIPVDLTVDLGSSEALAAMALGEGWSVGEEIQGSTATWAIEQGAQVFLPVSGDAEPLARRLTVRALPFEYPGSGEQKLAPSVNGQRLDEVLLSSGWNEYAWDVPAEALRSGPNDIRLEFARLDAPSDVLPGDGAIGSTGVHAPVSIEVNSGGPAGFAFIAVEGGEGREPEDGSVHRPGYNVAVIDPQTGEIIDRKGFDTTPDGAESEAESLAHFITGIANGQIVAVAMQGDGAARLDDAAMAALGSIGGQADPRGASDWSHAIIGVKGARPGSAPEAAGPGTGWLRAAPDRRTLAIAVDTIRWEQTGE